MINVKPLSLDSNGELSEADGATWMRQFDELQQIQRCNEIAIAAATNNPTEQECLRAYIAGQGEGYILR